MMTNSWSVYNGRLFGCIKYMRWALLQSMIEASVCHVSRLCKNGWMDLHPAWVPGDPRSSILHGGPHPPTAMRPLPSYCDHFSEWWLTTMLKMSIAMSLLNSPSLVVHNFIYSKLSSSLVKNNVFTVTSEGPLWLPTPRGHVRFIVHCRGPDNRVWQFRRVWKKCRGWYCAEMTCFSNWIMARVFYFAEVNISVAHTEKYSFSTPLLYINLYSSTCDSK